MFRVGGSVVTHPCCLIGGGFTLLCRWMKSSTLAAWILMCEPT